MVLLQENWYSLVLTIEEKSGKVYGGYEKLLIDVCTVICLGSDILLLFHIEVNGIFTHTDQFSF